MIGSIGFMCQDFGSQQAASVRRDQELPPDMLQTWPVPVRPKTDLSPPVMLVTPL